MINIPTSISALQYRDYILFKVIMAAAIGLTAWGGHYAASVAFAGVYVFRYFRKPREMKFHYLFAIVGFIVLAFRLGFEPFVLGSVVAITLKLLKSYKYIFWFEIIAGLGYVIKILN